jgi:hypothetical protein
MRTPPLAGARVAEWVVMIARRPDAASLHGTTFLNAWRWRSSNTRDDATDSIFLLGASIDSG